MRQFTATRNNQQNGSSRRFAGVPISAILLCSSFAQGLHLQSGSSHQQSAFALSNQERLYDVMNAQVTPVMEEDTLLQTEAE